MGSTVQSLELTKAPESDLEALGSGRRDYAGR